MENRVGPPGFARFVDTVGKICPVHSTQGTNDCISTSLLNHGSVTGLLLSAFLLQIRLSLHLSTLRMRKACPKCAQQVKVSLDVSLLFLYFIS